MEITQESLAQSEWAVYEKWYQQVRLSLDEDQARHNTVLIVTNLKSAGYTVTAENLTRTLQRLYTLPKTTIYNAPAAAPADARATQHTNKDFSKSGWNENVHLPELDGKNDRLNKWTPSVHASNPALATQPTAAQVSESFKGRADKAAQGDTAAETATLRKIFVTQSGLRINALTDDVSWERTYIAREEAYKTMRRNKETSR
jgi:hypothetical protein